MDLQPQTIEFLPRGVVAPHEANVEGFVLRPLNPSFVAVDYEAVMGGRDRLKDFFGLNDPWPPASMTIADNLHDLQWHESEFLRRSSFTYTVLEPGETRCAGCVYVYPPTRIGYDVELFAWLRADRYSTDDEHRFISRLKEWLAGVWDLRSIGMPGREIPWEDWNRLPSNNRTMPSPPGGAHF